MTYRELFKDSRLVKSNLALRGLGFIPVKELAEQTPPDIEFLTFVYTC